MKPSFSFFVRLRFIYLFLEETLWLTFMIYLYA